MRREASAAISAAIALLTLLCGVAPRHVEEPVPQGHLQPHAGLTVRGRHCRELLDAESSAQLG